MKFLDINFLAKGNSITPAKVTNQDMMNFIKYGGVSQIGAGQAYQYYETIGALGDAVDMISNKFADIKPVINDKDGQVVKRPEIDRFFDSPNDYESWNEFAINIATNFLLNNNAIIQVMGNINRIPSMILNVPNNTISVSSGANETNYILTTTGFFQFLQGQFKITAANPRILDGTDLRELYHIRAFNQNTDSFFSKSRLNSITKEMEVIDQSLVKMRSLLINGFSAASLASIKTQDKDAFDQVKSDLNNLFSGPGNSGRLIAAMADSLDIKNIEQTNRDLQTMENKTDSKNTVYSRFEIPQPLVNQTSQTYNNYQTALYSLYDNAVIPLTKKIFQKLTKVFKDRKALKDGEFISFDESSIPCLQLRLAEKLKLLKEVGVHSVNEIRGVYGSEEIGPEGDQIFIEASKIPIGEDDQTDDNPKEKRKALVHTLKKQGSSDDEVLEYLREYKEISGEE